MVKLIHLMRRARQFRHRSRIMGGYIRAPKYYVAPTVVKKPSRGWFGFGRRRRRGGSLMPAGGALNPVGFSRMRMRNLPMNY